MHRVHAPGETARQCIALHDGGNARMGRGPDGERPHDCRIAVRLRVHAMRPGAGKPRPDPGKAE